MKNETNLNKPTQKVRSSFTFEVFWMFFIMEEELASELFTLMCTKQILYSLKRSDYARKYKL